MGRTLLFFLAVVVLGCTSSDDLSTAESSNPEIESLVEKALKLKDQQVDSSFALAQRALTQSRNESFQQGVATSALIIAEICYEKGEYKKANAYLVESVTIFRELEDYSSLGKAYNLVGLIYQYNDRFDLAREQYGAAIASYESIGDTRGRAQTFGNLGHLHEKMGAYDSAIYYNLRAEEVYLETMDSLGLASIYDNIGSVYEDLEDFEKARENFQLAYQINRNTKNLREAVGNSNNIADTYRKTGDYEEALTIYFGVIKEAKRLNQPYQIKSAYRDISRTYSLLEEHEKSFRYLDSCYVVADELASQEIARGIEETRSVYELERQQRQIELLEKNKRIDLIVRSSLIVLAALLVIIGLLVFLQLKTRMKKNQQLFQAEKDLAQARQAQLETDLDLKKLREEKMFQEMESMSKELTANALNIIRKNKFLDQLKKELKTMKSSKDEAMNKSIKKVIRSINYTFSIDEDWQEFETVFQQVHARFFEQLRKEYPNLTSTETRLCAMMRLNLDSKDMATIMGISQDSLRIARYRLRKKLGIDKGANLYSFMMNIG